jgi:hypothetical protein
LWKRHGGVASTTMRLVPTDRLLLTAPKMERCRTWRMTIDIWMAESSRDFRVLQRFVML